MTLAAQLAPTIRKSAVARQRLAVRFMEAELDRRVPRATGQLARSRRTTESFGPLLLRTTIEYPLPQADFTDVGTRPHVIRPRRARVLVFRPSGRGASPVGTRSLRGRPRAGRGGLVYARIVHHPGTKGTRWFQGAFTDSLWRRFLTSAGRFV